MGEERDKQLIQMMSEIKKQPDNLKEFAADPLGYLKRKGLDVDGLTLAKAAEPAGGDESPAITDDDLALVAGGSCFSVGYYACYSEG
jgi:hypothetical protein